MRHANATGTFAYLPEFNKQLADVQRDEGLQFKNARLAREELEALHREPKGKRGGKNGKQEAGEE